MKKASTSEVSDRDKSNQSRAVYEAQFRLLANASSKMIYRMSPDWKIMYNLNGKNVMQEMPEPTGNWLERYIPSSEQPAVETAIQEAIRLKQVFQLEHQVYQRDGSVGWVFSRAIPWIDDKSGNILEWFGTATDITEKRQAGKQLMEQAIMIRKVADDAPGLIYVIDIEKKQKVYANKKTLAMLGLSMDAVTALGQELFERYVFPEDKPAFYDNIERLKQATDDEVIEFCYRIYDGQRNLIWLQSNRSVYKRDEQGQVTHIIGVGCDITEQQHPKEANEMLEQERRQLKAAQQRLIAGATLKAREEERRRIAESLHNGLGQLLYGLRLSLGALNQDEAVHTPERFIQSKRYSEDLITQSIRECRRIAHQLLPPELETFGLKAALDTVCHQLNGEIKIICRYYGLSHRLDYMIELVVFRAAQELLINIIKHAKAAIATMVLRASDQYIKLSVNDDGQGITSRTEKSAGIGITLIRSNVKLLNGKTKIISEPGKGTTVIIAIPLHS